MESTDAAPAGSCGERPSADGPGSASHPSTPPTSLGEETLSMEQLKQIWDWNTPVPPTINRLMHDLIKEQAKKQPQQPAIHSWDGDFTYYDVDSLSDTFASHLVSLGVGLGVIVPLCFEKSKWTVVAVLAVMKAGGAFALMDPSQPAGRLRAIVDQTAATVVVTSELQQEVGGRIAPKATRVTLSRQALDDHSHTNTNTLLLPEVPPDASLYIQFTSGSTGQPKGVVITHANYTSGAVPRAAAVGYHARSRVLDFASYAFDVCIDCMLCTLAAGGCLCIPSDAARVNDLSGAIRALGVNMAHMTPSVARVLDPDIVPRLDVLGLGGEAISTGDAMRWSGSGSGSGSGSTTTKVINAYGPSECTVGCAVNPDVGAESHKPQVTIGRGVGASLWIVDPLDHDQLVPIGAVGELLVEGPIVGPGYLGQPEKTAEVFVRDPRWLLAGSQQHGGRTGRLYKTGDLVKYDSDGTIVFVGRGDQQVKLRGQRIELAEIEYNMRDHLPPGTRVAAEVIKPAGAATAEPTLVAFVAERAGLVPAESEEPLLGATHSAQIEDALADMDRLLSDRLPVYMIPAAYLPLHTMPLLVSAKTDRKRLRALGSSLSRKAIAGFAAAATAPRREPSTPMERELAGLWAAVLGLESSNAGVGAGDNFFVLGGDSLRAMRLVARARSSGVALLTVADIFTHPVLSEMAVAARPAAGKTSRVPEIPSFSLLPPAWDAASARAECAALCDGVDDPARVEDVYPCTPLQEGLMALSAKVGGGGSGGEAAYVAQRVVELPDEAAARRLLAAFEVAARGCAILRTRIVQVPEHGLVQVVVRDDFEHAWWSADRGGLGDYLAADRDASVALGRRLVRYGVVCGGEEETGRAHFVLTMHHALYDGWSMPLIVERVNRAYAGLDTTRLADFKHFIGHLGRMDRPWSEAYWREHLAGAAGAQFPPLPWPGYQPRADSLLEHYVRAGGQPRAGATMATVIRGAWALLVAAYTASASTADVVFGETLTGRNAPIPGVEQVEGPMIATVPVRVAVAVDGDGEDKDANAMTAAEYLGAIHDQSVRGMPHEHLGLQHIRRVSPDAREACELRTGLVLHPSSTEAADNGDSSEAGTFLERPADGFVPASDAEAAQEALKFNTYALMLVCSMDPDGFLVMASFDSNTVAASQMKRMLAQLESVTRQLISHPNKPCAEIVEVLAEGDVAELTRLGRSPSSLAAASSSLLAENQEVTETWIVDPANAERLLPLGAVGELVVRCPSVPLDTMDQVTTPKYADSDLPGCLYRTQKLAKYSEDGKLESVERTQRAHVPQARQARKHVSATSRKQKELRRAWSRVLSIEEDAIGLDDSFFQLGGDSIGAMKIVADLRARGLELTVPDIFKHRTLYETAKATTQKAKGAAGAAAAEANKLVEYAPFSLLQDEGRDVDAFLADTVRPTIQKSLIWQQDGKKDYTILDVLPARPLQRVAVRGTTRLPRYSARYELFHFDGPVDRARLFGACGQLVARNEILRTVFVEDKEDAADAKCYGVVLDALDVAFEQHECDDDDLEAFCHRLCDADIQTDMPLGSAFVKFMFVQQRGEKGGGEAAAAAGGRSSLILRISHAQYDEICLVGLLRQLAALYNGHPETTASPAPAVPFSAFVHHVVREAIPRSIPYWRDLLRGSGPPTRLRPGPGCCSSSLPLPPLRSRAAGALTRTLDISARPRDVTVATLPTAAWALCLARRLALRDVVFGEVVSGRNIDLPIGGSGAGVGGAEAVMGPTWQYVPVRVCFEGDGKSEEGDCKWTGLDLLRYVQHQHIASAQHEGMGLGEMARSCTDWPPPPPAMGLLDGEEEEAKGEKEGAAALEDYWFDSVVHQDVYHVERLDFFDNANAGASTGTGCRLETVYPHAEPLREWKVQAFAHRGGDSLTLEIVTFKDWLGVAAELLDEMAKIMDMLVRRPDKRLF